LLNQEKSLDIFDALRVKGFYSPEIRYDPKSEQFEGTHTATDAQ